ncbi:MAG: hypothetical protein JRG71_08380 [Deltaproteobacteria bacterium]|nr:hypothetical protein [Deltaproteobacteria bacterium]
MAGKVWMLFECGAAAEVVLSAHLTPEGNSRPIEAYLTLECDRSFSHAALRGAETAYTWARGKLFHLSPQIISYDLLDLPKDRGVKGESGGLAFALALATHLYGDNSLPIAATGEIVASADGGPVTSIKGINAKLGAAITLLPEDGLIFYPKENEFEVSTKVQQQALAKGLPLHAVESVEQALNILFPEANLISPHKALKPWHFIVFLALLSILVSAIFSDDDKATDTVKKPQHVQQVDESQAITPQDVVPVPSKATPVTPEEVPAIKK